MSNEVAIIGDSLQLRFHQSIFEQAQNQDTLLPQLSFHPGIGQSSNIGLSSVN